jgi:hypothetical protein
MIPTDSEKEQLRQEKKALREEKKKLKKQQLQQEGQTQDSATMLPPPTPYRRVWRSTFRHRPITIMSHNVSAYNVGNEAMLMLFIRS